MRSNLSFPGHTGWVMDESKNTTGNTDVVRSPPSLEPSYLYKSCLISLKISMCAHKAISCATWSCLFQCRCVAWHLAGPGQPGTDSRRLSSPWAAGRLVSPRRKFFSIISNTSHSHTKPMFCNKNKERISSKGILPISPSTYSTEVIFLKKTIPPKLATRTTK